MIEFFKIPLGSLDFNTGQIAGLPANPRSWTDAEIKKLAKSMKATPELAEARGCIVVPYGGRYVVLGVAEREKAEREKAEREKAERWILSERELAIVQRLNRASHETTER